MIIKNITQLGNKVIRTRAKLVSKPTSKSTKIVVKNLVDSMRHHGLVGIAAPQIGKSVRIFVTEIRKTKYRKQSEINDGGKLRIFINPRILSVSKKQVNGWEGCGSVANAQLFGMVKRPASVVVEALDKNGEKFNLKANNLLSRVIQHEIDHLNGIVFTDKADPSTYVSREEYFKLAAKKK
jgi:peptide deformylase